jgi:uncharacterized protein
VIAGHATQRLAGHGVGCHDAPMRLPHFPLHQVAFPHLPLPLHLFEERYRAMAADVVAEGSSFEGRFVVSMITEGREVGGDARAQTIGTVCEVRSAERFPDGRWVFLVVGVARARITSIDRNGLYAVADVEILGEPIGEEASQLVPQVQSALDGYLASVKRFVARTASHGDDASAEQENRTVRASLDEVLKPIHLPDDPVSASYAVAGVLPVELSRKQQLLELPDATARLRAELEVLRRESRLLEGEALPPIPVSDLGYHPN